MNNKINQAFGKRCLRTSSGLRTSHCYGRGARKISLPPRISHHRIASSLTFSLSQPEPPPPPPPPPREGAAKMTRSSSLLHVAFAFILSTLVLACVTSKSCCCYAFTLNASVQSKSAPRRHAATTTTRTSTRTATAPLSYSRQICSFDAEDFALPTGEWPYSDADMNRIDNTDDENFYNEPRFVTHIDDYAIQSLTEYYREEMMELSRQKKNIGGEDNTALDVLDLCSSWISHLPDESDGGIKYGRVVGVGMNEKELEANKQLTEHRVQNLNIDPKLPFEDNSFDVVCNVVSVDYLTKPFDVFKETHRVLRLGGKCLISFSNRCFPTKAVAMWLQADDIDRLTIVASYFHYSEKWEGGIEALDIKIPAGETPKRPSLGEMFSNPGKGFAWANTASAVAKVKGSDPMFVVKGVK